MLVGRIMLENVATVRRPYFEIIAFPLQFPLKCFVFHLKKPPVMYYEPDCGCQWRLCREREGKLY